MFIRKEVTGTQQTNKQTQQMGQKNVIENLRSMEPSQTNKQTKGTNGSEEGHTGNQVNGTQQTNKQTKQIGQKKVIKESGSV